MAPDAVTQVEEILVFPTYAYRDERLKVWRVQVRGWAFCRNPSAKRVRIATTAMRKLIGIPRGGESDQLLLDRVSYLFAGQPASTDMVHTAMSGISEPEAFELRKTTGPSPKKQPVPPKKPPRRDASPLHPPSSSSSSNDSSQPAVSLLDAPIVLTSQFNPTAATQAAAAAPAGNVHTEDLIHHPAVGGTGAHKHDRLVVDSQLLTNIEPTIMQQALQIDAFSWQTLVLDEGLFQGEILLGYNELEWLMQSYKTAHSSSSSNGSAHRRRLIELRGKLYGWADDKLVAGVAHLVEPEGISVISDIDDTIKASNITADKRIVLETVFARPLQAVPGMAELYREWYKLGGEFHYVSNSPWQLYPSLDDFFHQNKFPPGSAHLRSFDPNGLLSVSNFTGTPQMKRDTIEQLFSVFPNRKYIFVGDCGEHDLETYTDLARRFPSRVLRIYIRDLFGPMSVASITTDTDYAGGQANTGVIQYGIVGPSKAGSTQQSTTGAALGGHGDIDDAADLIHLGAPDGEDSEYNSDASNNRQLNRTAPSAAPPVPPKPSHLRKSPSNASSLEPSSAGSSTVPPPKPRRSPTLTQTQSLQALHQANAAAQASVLPPPPPPRRSEQPMPGSWNTSPANIVPGTITSSGDGPMAGGQAPFSVEHLREQAQAWMAFYAQKFYVAPTRSFLHYANLFMPTVEANPHIIQYESIPSDLVDANTFDSSSPAAAAAYRQQRMGSAYGAQANVPNDPYTNLSGFKQAHQSSSAMGGGPASIGQAGGGYQSGVSASGTDTPISGGGLSSRSSSFASFNIPEPPPPEAQLARNNRRLLLWKRYLEATRGLDPDLCRLFVDASDIKQDVDLFDNLFPRYAPKQP
ncbi:hypothetical protein GQ54DRAFT_296169, partial [Martensiomyces pterosporus]